MQWKAEGTLETECVRQLGLAARGACIIWLPARHSGLLPLTPRPHLCPVWQQTCGQQDQEVNTSG